MKNSFLEYNSLSKDEIQDLWDSAIFVFDANVLLNLYRYSDNTSKRILQIISDLKDRVWLRFKLAWSFIETDSVSSAIKRSFISTLTKSSVILLTKLRILVGTLSFQNRHVRNLTLLKHRLALKWLTRWRAMTHL